MEDDIIEESEVLALKQYYIQLDSISKMPTITSLPDEALCASRLDFMSRLDFKSCSPLSRDASCDLPHNLSEYSKMCA